MQDFHSMMPGSSGRIFAASGDQRRLPGYPSPAAGTQPPIKCPRCDSSNTKFCYYNNYNLSQPRHFCKSCRRYWTKGGVLRNVPVGGGSRKSSSSSSSSSKRAASSSSSKKSSSPSASAATAATAAADKDRCRPQSSRSSSDNSSLTATDAAPLLSNHNPNPDRAPEPGGSVAELIPGAGFGFLDLAGGEIRVADPAAGMVDLGPRIGGGLINGLDWAAPVFDITGAVDQGAAYWNQSHWDDSDPSLYLP